MKTNKHEGAEREAHHATQLPADKNMMAIFSYLWILIIIPFLTKAKNDPFVKFHLRQGLALIVYEVIGMLIGWIPILGWIAGFIIWISSFVFAVTGILNVVHGREKELPWIGKYAKHFDF